MKRVGLIGNPVGHSVSPVFQQAAFDHLALDYRYEAWDTLPAGLEQRMASLRGEDIAGANITVPHKEEAVPYLDEVDETAREIGAVNTVVNHEGRLSGHNTDVGGFLLACNDAGIDPSTRPAIVVGAGGAARAVTVALTKSDLRSILVLNRTLERARKLAVDFGVGCDTLEAAPASTFRSARLVINATSLGLQGGPAELPLDPARLSPGCVVIDLVVNPEITPFLEAAEAAGCETLGGLSMLVHQGAASFELWTGRRAPVGIMMQAAGQVAGRAQGL